MVPSSRPSAPAALGAPSHDVGEGTEGEPSLRPTSQTPGDDEAERSHADESAPPRLSQAAFPMIGVPIEIGEVVAGTYRIEGMLGEGAMGMVTVARHQTLGHRVAIKFLHPHIARQTHAAERFRREARTAASIRGAHTCRVLDVGTHGNGLPYLVMEHLEGHTLADELQVRGLLPYREAVAYVLEACEGLAEAHARGIVHRDIKPANLFLETRVDGTRSIKVLDFGVSKSLAATVGRLTTSMNLLGSPLYCSPEHLRSARDLDARSDIWSLGVVLYELITGLLPFDADSLPQLLHAVLSNPIPAPQTLGIDIPVQLSAVLERALAKDPDQRYASVAELAGALVPFALAELEAGQRAKRMLAVSSGGITPTHAAPGTYGATAMYGTTPAEPRSTHASLHDVSPLHTTQRVRPPQSARMWAGLAIALVLSCWVLLYGWARIVTETPARGTHGAQADAVARLPALPTRERSSPTIATPPARVDPPAPPAPASPTPEAPARVTQEAEPKEPAARSPALPSEGTPPREAHEPAPKHEAVPALRPHAAVPPLPREPARDEAAPARESSEPGAAARIPFPVTDFGGRH